MDRIKFSNKIMTDRVRKKGEKRCRYDIVQWGKKRRIWYLNDISDHVKLVQLIDTGYELYEAPSSCNTTVYLSIFEYDNPETDE